MIFPKALTVTLLIFIPFKMPIIVGVIALLSILTVELDPNHTM
jgi:hypothetical protein